jgi:hypothetical protein
MMKIGDFSKLSRVSIKTLRYYDEMGLLKPISIDGSTGYRSYAASQLPRLNRILALKDLGFSLQQIGQTGDAPARIFFGHDLIAPSKQPIESSPVPAPASTRIMVRRRLASSSCKVASAASTKGCKALFN